MSWYQIGSRIVLQQLTGSQISFIAGFFISGTVYVALHIIFPAQKVQHFVEDTTTTASMLMRSYRLRWDGETDEADIDERIIEGLRTKDGGDTSEVAGITTRFGKV